MTISLIGTASTDASSGTAVSLTHGLSIQSGDVIIATVNANGSGNTVTDNNGSTAFTTDHYADNPDSARYYVMHRVAGASEPSSYAFTLGSSGRWSIVVRQYRGVDSSVWDVAPSADSLNTGTSLATGLAVADSITIATSGACGLVLMGDDFNPTTSTYSSIDNDYGNAAYEAGAQYQATADKLNLSTGATGDTTLTSSYKVAYAIYQVALKPSAASVSYLPGVMRHHIIAPKGVILHG